MKNQIILVSFLAAVTAVGCIDVVEKKDGCVAKCDTKDGKNIAISCLGHGRSIEIVCDDAAPACEIDKDKNTAACKPKPCESVCSEDKMSVFKCDDKGVLSKTPESCGEDVMCVEGACKCFAVCTTDGKIRACDDNGKLKPAENCPNAAETCLDGKKGESNATCGPKTECRAECVEGDKTKIKRCLNNTLGEAESCPDGKVCKKEGDAAADCVLESAPTPECTKDVCEGIKIKKCMGEKLSEPAYCEPTQMCSDGACAARTCVPPCTPEIQHCVADSTDPTQSACVSCVPKCDNGKFVACNEGVAQPEVECGTEGKQCFKAGGAFENDFCGCADYCEKVEGQPDKAHQCKSPTEDHAVVECTGETPVCKKDEETGKATCVAVTVP